MNNVSTVKKKFANTEWDYYYATQDSLRIHVMVHLNNKTYSCNSSECVCFKNRGSKGQMIF